MPQRCRVLLKRDYSPRFLGGGCEVEMVPFEHVPRGDVWDRAFLWIEVNNREGNSPVQYCGETDGSTLIKPLNRSGYSLIQGILGCPSGHVVRLCDLNHWNSVVTT